MKPRRPRRLFVDLRSAEMELTGSDTTLFLGRFAPEALQAELEASGLLAALAAKGHGRVEIRSEIAAGEHRLLVHPLGDHVSLIDLRMAEASALVEEPLAQDQGLDVLSFLAIHWLSSQDPLARFTDGRPRLPGQTLPGLGIGRRLLDLVLGWARAWGKDGLVNFPEYFHNALFYSKIFRFLSPGRQGRFEALARDLQALPTAAASWAIEEGRVVDLGSDQAFTWEPGEMVVPLTPRLTTYLESAAYRVAVGAEKETARFEVRESPAVGGGS